MAPEFGGRQIDDGPNAVISQSRPKHVRDIASDGVEIPCAAVVVLASRVGITDVLMGQRDTGIIRRNITENGPYDSHRVSSARFSLGPARLPQCGPCVAVGEDAAHRVWAARAASPGSYGATRDSVNERSWSGH